MRRLEHKGKENHVKRHSQLMAIRHNDEHDENVITSRMENMHIDTQPQTID